MKYRKKPITIEAIVWEGNINVLRQFVGPHMPLHQLGDAVGIETLEGVMKAQPGDYIICGSKGEFYPCKPDIFVSTYDAVGD